MENHNMLLPVILGTNSSIDNIKEALNLVSKDPETGLPIRWTSQNPEVIATSGRVIRPRWDERPINVTLVAEIDETRKENFEFTVLPDKYIGDTMAKTDDKFFGFYYNGSWRTRGELRYDDFPELSAVQDAAKKSDYALAKEELLKYMRKKISKTEVPTFSRNSLYADYMVSGGSENTNNDYCTAEADVASFEYQKIEIPLSQHGIKAGVSKTYSLLSKYRDSVALSFAGTNYPEEDKRPMLLIYVNGVARYYPAIKAATIRGGKYKNTHFGTSEELTVKMFGEFAGDETYRTLLQFDTSNISQQDALGQAVLILYGKKIK